MENINKLSQYSALAQVSYVDLYEGMPMSAYIEEIMQPSGQPMTDIQASSFASRYQRKNRVRLDLI